MIIETIISVIIAMTDDDIDVATDCLRRYQAMARRMEAKE